MPGHDSGVANKCGMDPRLAEVKRQPEELGARARALKLLNDAGVPFVVGGAYAYAHYTGIHRDTKDLDLFLRKADADRAIELFEQNGWRTEHNTHGWLHKAFWNECLVDLIYSAGNGIPQVDDAWIANGVEGQVLGQRCLISPAEEIIWSKAFVLERERFDGTELNHLILAQGPKLNWERLVQRFERYWEVLLGHLMFFRFAYPSEREHVPAWVMWGLLGRGFDSVRGGNWSGKLCRGRLLSQPGYLVDVEERGYEDGLTWDAQERDRPAAPPKQPLGKH